MIFGMGIIISTLVFSFIITTIYFSKKKVDNFETKIYNVLSILSMLCLIIEFWLCTNILLDVELYGMYNLFVNRSFLFSLFSWFSIFTLYLLIVSFRNNTKMINRLKKMFGDNYNKSLLYIVVPILIICILLLLFLPIDLVKENGAAYSQGPAVNIVYFSAVFYLFVWIICITINHKNVRFKKFIPFIAFIVCFGMILIARNFYPALLLNSFSVAFATILMFHTIENPDVKLIEELNENRIIVEKTNEEKSNFIFKLTGEIKNPVSYIYHVSEDLLEENDITKLQKGINVIHSSSRRLSYIINDITDVTGLDNKKIKVINSNYNIYNIIDEIKVRLNKEKKDNIELRYNIDNNLPESLYGDVIKLKQVIMTFLSNSLKYTKKGFIEFNIDSIIKYDVCRLIITIEDSGIGMNISKVNDLLKSDEELTDEDLSKLGTIDLDIKLAKKVIKYLGGSIMIKSEEEKGTEIIITLDQKIKDIEKSNTSMKYENASFRNKRVLVVNDNIEELNIIEDIFKEQNVNVTTTMYGKDCIDKINSKEKFDLIIVDDEMPNLSGLDTLNELKSIKGFNTPVVIMLSKVKEGIKHHYIEDGFKDYILKENIKSETSRIAKKFI